VAIKRVWGLHGSFEEAAHAATEFEREIAMLSQLRHPNVVRVVIFTCLSECLLTRSKVER
jgi:hypothetical protein